MEKSKAQQIAEQFAEGERLLKSAREALNVNDAVRAQNVFFDIVQDGEAITRDEALAQTLWNMALGSEYKNEDGKACFRLPDKSVAIFIVERREGRMPMTSQMEDSTGMSAADKVDELAKARINAALPEETNLHGVPWLHCSTNALSLLSLKSEPNTALYPIDCPTGGRQRNMIYLYSKK